MNIDKKISGKVLFIGDSITDDGRYVSYINTYLGLYQPNIDITIFNLGVCSETISGITEDEHPFPRPCVFGRLTRILDTVQPDWVISLYGVNDAIYSAYSDANFSAFSNGYIRLAEIIKSYSARLIILTPVHFDAKSYNGNVSLTPPFGYLNTYAKYDDVMTVYSEWLLANMAQYADRILDMHTALKLDRDKLYAENPKAKSGDGIHPDERGHFVMANFLLGELFGVDINSKDKKFDKYYTKYCQTMYRQDKITHSYYKELIGHDNIYKDKVLSDTEKNKEIAKITKKADKISKKLLNDTKKWNGFKCNEFYFEGYRARIVFPKQNITKNWVYRTEFFGAFANADIAMLNNGYYLINIEICDKYGDNKSVEIMNRFVSFVTSRYQLNSKGILFGFSRGALYATNYASKYPHTVKAIYLDNPVVDISSWPCGQGKGKFAEVESVDCLKRWGLNNPSEYKQILYNAIDNLVTAKIPIIIVAGSSDSVVPYDENGIILEQSWTKNNIDFELIMKNGCDHHPHSLDNPQPIVDFLTKYK